MIVEVFSNEKLILRSNTFHRNIQLQHVISCNWTMTIQPAKTLEPMKTSHIKNTEKNHQPKMPQFGQLEHKW